MRIRIARTAKQNGRPIAYVVKINGRKYPKGSSNFYFPKNCKRESAIQMALNDYNSESECECEEGNINVTRSRDNYIDRKD